VDNPGRYQNILEQRIEEPFPESTYSNVIKKNNDNIKLGFGCMMDPKLIEDDIES
jgi:hypothetical protein